MKSEVLTQTNAAGHRKWQVGDFLVDEQQRSVGNSTGTQTLTDLSWRLLLCLIEAAPDPLSAEKLARQVWRRPHVSNEALAQRVRQLRQILGDDVKAPAYIRTLRGNGYQLIPQPRELTPKGPRKRRLALVAVTVGILTGLAALFFLRPDTPTTPDRGELLSKRADEYRQHVLNDSNEIAIGLYRESLETDPYNTSALVGLSLALSSSVSKFGHELGRATEAAQMADRALALTPSDSQALAARGFADDVQGRISEAIRYYEDALASDPSNRSARASLAYLLQIKGELHAALQLDAQAYAAEPSAYFTELQISNAFYLAGLPNLAESWLDKSTTMRPDNVFLADAAARRLWIEGKKEEALRRLDGARFERSSQLALYALLQSALGLPEAKESFRKAQEIAKTSGYVCISCLTFAMRNAPDLALVMSPESANLNEWPEAHVEHAAWELANSRADKAYEALTRAVELGYRDWQWLSSHPFLAEISQSDKFKLLVGEIKRLVDLERRNILADTTLRAILQNPSAH